MGDDIKNDFPILCETCLGDNPYMRMMKNVNGAECKTCARPMTVFRWKPGTKARYKKTEICQTCAKVKNVCQTCILDLQYGLPVMARDTLVPKGEAAPVPQSDTNREYFADQAEQQAAAGTLNPYESTPNANLMRLARNQPYYKRNRAHVCSFWVKGACNRGDACPYRHEWPENTDESLRKQNLKDRYYGTNDPVAKKILGVAGGEDVYELRPPEDKTVTTLFVGGTDERVTEGDLREIFSQYGPVVSVRMIQRVCCAFVTMARREDAEQAAEHLKDKISVKGLKLRLQWGRAQSQYVGDGNSHFVSDKPDPVYPKSYLEPQDRPNIPSEASSSSQAFKPPPPAGPPPNFMKVGSSGQPIYPSMDPSALGAKGDK